MANFYHRLTAKAPKTLRKFRSKDNGNRGGAETQRERREKQSLDLVFLCIPLRLCGSLFDLQYEYFSLNMKNISFDS
jgi:hypothetical protein